MSEECAEKSAAVLSDGFLSEMGLGHAEHLADQAASWPVGAGGGCQDNCPKI